MMQQFKDKDWLRVIAGHERPINSVFQIESCLTRYKLSDVELWQPKEGEWCWFWRYEDTVPILAKFLRIEKCLRTSIIDKFSPEFFIVSGRGYGDNSFQYCEPFIGKLPSHLRK